MQVVASIWISRQKNTVSSIKMHCYYYDAIEDKKMLCIWYFEDLKLNSNVDINVKANLTAIKEINKVASSR